MWPAAPKALAIWLLVGNAADACSGSWPADLGLLEENLVHLCLPRLAATQPAAAKSNFCNRS